MGQMENLTEKIGETDKTVKKVIVVALSYIVT